MADTGPSPPRPEKGTARVPHDAWAISVTSLFSDWSYEMILPVLPFFLTLSLAATPFVVGLVDGAAQFAQSAVQPIAGERWARGPRRRVRGAYGYLTTTISHGLIAIAVSWPQVLVLRVGAWLGRGSRQPVKKAILAGATPSERQGASFGLEQAFDSAGAVLGTATAVTLLMLGGLGEFRTIFAVSVLPGFVAAAVLLIFVQDRAARSAAPGTPRRRTRWSELPRRFRVFLLAEVVFGFGYFSILLALLRVGENLMPSAGGSLVGAIVAALLLYLLYNLLFAGLSYPAGRWADRAPGVGLIALSFVLFAGVDALPIGGTGLLGGVLAFTVAGVQAGLQGVTESAWVAREVPGPLVGPAFGWLGIVQGISVLGGSLLAGGLWTYSSAPLAFAVSGVLAVAGAVTLVPLARRATPNGPLHASHS